MAQRTVTANGVYGLGFALDELFVQGWRIVPGSMGCASYIRNTTGEGRPVYETRAWAVVEKAEEL